MLRREKIKVQYPTSHLSKIVRTLSPPTDFSFAVPSPPGVKIIRANIDYRAAPMPNTLSAAYPFSLVLDCRRDRRPPLLSTSLSSHRLLPPSAARQRPLRHRPPSPTAGRAFHEAAATAATAVATTSVTMKIMTATAATRGRRA